MLFILFVINSLLFLEVTCHPVVIKTGGSSNKGHEEHHNDEAYDGSVKKGETNFENAEGFDKSNDKKVVAAQDQGNYNEEVANKKNHIDENSYAGEKFNKKSGGDVTNVGVKTGHKKGHHKVGFHNSYHKDESGSNTSFYDDAEDVGDQYERHTSEGAYGDTEKQNTHGAHVDGGSYSKEEGKQGGYSNAGSHEQGQGNHKNYGQKQYYDDHTAHGKSNADNNYGEAGHHVEERFHQKPHVILPKPHYYRNPDYYVPLPPPPPPVYAPKRTITVYEDPRIEYAKYNRYDDPSYADDYVQLDFKHPPPSKGYRDYKAYDRYPSYDYYY